MSPELSKPDRKDANASPPAVWSTMAKEVREYDQDNVKRGKGDVDTLLVFVSTTTTWLSYSIPNSWYMYLGWSLLCGSGILPGRCLP